MRYRYFIFLVAIGIFTACKKQGEIVAIPPQQDPPVPTVLLKDIIIPNLPSPYYHFEYNTKGKTVFASFASGFNMYNIVYSGERISEMRNNILVNKDTLRYSYDNAGRVNAIKYINEAGTVYTVIFFTYDGQKLVEIERDRRSGTGFIIDKIMTMSYHPDSNLKDLTYHYLPFNGQPEQIYTDRFEQYDDKINVDGFGLIHNEFFDHLILLPGTVLQKNNPRKETRSGDGWNYTVDYTYTYNDANLPLTKKGNMVVLTGTNAGQRFETNSFYSYY